MPILMRSEMLPSRHSRHLKSATSLALGGIPPEVFFVVSFDGRVPQGSVTFHEAFKAEGQQENAVDKE